MFCKLQAAINNHVYEKIGKEWRPKKRGRYIFNHYIHEEDENSSVMFENKKGEFKSFKKIKTKSMLLKDKILKDFHQFMAGEEETY